MTDVVISRRRLLGGAAALFAVAAAPALAVPRIAPDSCAEIDFEVVREEWLVNPRWFIRGEMYWYRCLVRHGSMYCFAMTALEDSNNLDLRRLARQECREYAKLWFAAEKENQNRIR